ncbi:MAG: tetratricopeptide repeat protein [Promethearchaeota archaeon]
MKSVEEITENVVHLRKEKHFQEAEDILRAAIAHDSNAWQLWNQLGHVLVAKEKYAEAASAFEAATELNPNGFWLWISLGYARKENTQLDGAIEATLRATKLTTEPNEIGSALYNLGCYTCIAGKHDEALGYLEVAFQNDESIREWARDDLDLESLKTDKRFLKLLKTSQ